jgi:hypothetical protein
MNSPFQPAGSRRVMSTGAGITLIALGAVLRFAVATTSTHGLNVHVVGIILMLAGVVGLALSLLVWGPLNSRRNRTGGQGGGMPSLVRRRRVYREQSPGVFQDQPPIVTEQVDYQDPPIVTEQVDYQDPPQR